MTLGPNEPTQSIVSHAHGAYIHSHGVIGAGMHTHPGIEHDPDFQFFALVPTGEQLEEQRRRAAVGRQRYLERTRAETGVSNPETSVERELREDAELREADELSDAPPIDTSEGRAAWRQRFRSALPPMSDEDWALFCRRMFARLGGEPHVHTRLCGHEEGPA